LAQKLVDTGARDLIEGNTWGDTFWGISGGKGENNLGKLLINQREELVSGGMKSPNVIQAVISTSADSLTPDEKKQRAIATAKARKAERASKQVTIGKPTSVSTTLVETPIQPKTQAHISSDQYKFTSSAEYIRDYQNYKQELERILAKPFEQMTKEEDLIVNSSDHITVRLMAEIKADKLKEPTSLSRAEQKLKTIKQAQKTAVADAKRKTNLLPIGTVIDTPETVVPVGDTVKDKLASIQALKNAAQTPTTMTDAQIRLEAAKARGSAMSPIDDLIDYGNDLINVGNFDNEIDYTDDLYRGMTNAKPVAAESAGATRAAPSAIIDDITGEVIEMAQKGKQTAVKVAQTAMASSARTTFRQLSVAENLIRDPKNIKMTALAATLGAGALGYDYSRRRNR